MADVADDFMDIRFDARGTARQKAKTALREQNKHEWVCDLVIVGNTQITSGVTFMVEDFGKFDGKYIVESADHRIAGDGGYTTAIKARRILRGY